ncbi:MAG: LacI family transcriptional regulator [Lachnospiraceae bacterium]|jgi:LacI family transcriptional regulator|nr:LacI family transcriptional regulator [Lachnospiraceae bacterium]
MATIKDIANRLGVSVSTVSKGLNGASDISEQLRQIVLDTAVEMGYTPKQMRAREAKKLCIFIENMEYETSEQFGYDIILGFKQAAYPAQYGVTVMPVTPDFQAGEKYDTYMLKNGYVGAFFVGFALQDAWLAQLHTTSIPTTLFDNYIRKNPNVSYIGTDSFEGIDDAIEHLISLGHRKIALLNGSAHSMITEQRRQAYIESMNAHGLEINEKWMPYGYYVAAAAKDHVANLLSLGATAIVCGNDLLASGALEECRANGFRVPEDVSIIGFDDIPISAKLTPSLTTIRQDRIELGKCGFYTLHSVINHVSICKNLLRPQLIIRDSTAPVRNNGCLAP